MSKKKKTKNVAFGCSFIRIVHYDFKGGVGDLCNFLGHYFFFLLLCVIFFWRAISCATILFNIKNRSWGTPLAPLFSTGRCACNVPNRPTPLPSPHYASVNLKTQLYFYG